MEIPKNEKKEVKKLVKKKVGKVLTKQFTPGGADRLRSHLLMKSNYMKTLLDPLNEVGVRVPDEVTAPSLTAQTIQRLQVTTTADGVAGCSFMVSSLDANPGNASGGDVMTCTSLATSVRQGVTTKTPASSPAFTQRANRDLAVSEDTSRPGPTSAVRFKRRGPDVGALGDYQWSPWNGSSGAKSYAAGIQATAGEGRVVSAALYAFYQGTPLEMSGRAVIQGLNRIENSNSSSASVVPSQAAQASSPFLTSSSMLSSRIATDKPLQAVKGQTSIRWLPMDEGDRLYFETSSLGGAAPTQTGRLTIVYEGLPTNASIEFWVVENWELLPQTQTISYVQPEPSLHDPIESAIVANAISENPFLQLAPARVTQGQRDGKVESNRNGPVTIHPPELKPQGSVMDTIFEAVERALPIGEKLLTLAGPLLALA